jgi:2-polyprenyl-6-hydroxyphenyl methylase/3-demethylubiquinone-9 3-methyltransferase
MEHSKEVASGQRFEFGANWARFLTVVNDERVAHAEASLKRMLKVEDLHGKRFLDAGSGSGLFSLAARRLGADVHSFDYDPQSVACTAELKRRYFPDDPAWFVEEGSVLDVEYLNQLGDFDIVYSWGVLHHTGAMWGALANMAPLVRAGGGLLYIAIYNDQGWVSRYWTTVKRLYNSGYVGELLMILLHLPYLFGLRYMVRLLSGRLRVERGMSLWYDMLDWLGGYPFEVSTPEQMLLFYREKGFVLANLKTCRGRHGCNEFIFSRA